VTTSTFRQNETMPRLNGARLWAGGVATAIAAALIAGVGLCVARGIFAVPVPVPTPTGGLSSVGYVGIAIGSLLTGVARSAVRRRPDALEPYQRYRSGEN
jgi:hypothetical protein